MLLHLRDRNIMVDAVKNLLSSKQHTIEKTLSIVSTCDVDFCGHCSAVSFVWIIHGNRTQHQRCRVMSNYGIYNCRKRAGASKALLIQKNVTSSSESGITSRKNGSLFSNDKKRGKYLNSSYDK